MITVVNTTGTSSKGVVLTLERKRASQIRRLRQGLTPASEEEAAQLAREITHLERDLITVAIDIDRANGADVPEPLDEDDGALPVTSNFPVIKPGPETIEKIKHGLLDGFYFLNPEAYKLMKADSNGTGGTRPNGRLLIEVAAPRLLEVIRGILGGIAQRRHEVAAGDHESVLVILLYSGYGGFASGAHAELEKMWEREASAQNFQVQILPLLMLPHGYTPDDPANTNGVTHGLLKELTAAATMRHHHRHLADGEDKPEIAIQPFHQTLLLSDTNNAGGKPRTLARRNFTGMVAQLVLDLAFTPLGERFIAKLTDFNAGAQNITALGETRHGLTAGVSSVVLDRERLYRFLAAELCCHFAERASLQIGPAQVLTDNRGFLEGRHLVQGDGREDLSNHLLQMRLPNDLVSQERAIELFHVNGVNLRGLALLRHGSEAMEAAEQQNGDFVAALSARREVVVQDLLTAVDRDNAALLGDPQHGLGVARQRTESLAAILLNMANLAATETATLQEQVNVADEQVRYFRETYLPALERRNGVYHWMHNGRIQGEALDYARALTTQFRAKCRLIAHQEAVNALTAMAHPLKERTTQLEAASLTVGGAASEATRERDRMVAHSPDLECPVGLSLLDKQEHFDAYRERLLPETVRATALTALYGALRQEGEIAAVLCDPARLRAALERGCELALRASVDALHVATEVLLRFPEREGLGRMLRERDMEAAERLVLKDSADAENSPVLVRLMGAAPEHANELLTLLNEFAQPRGHDYTVVNTNDPDRLVFMQIRAGFPMSDWARTSRTERDYRRAAASGRVERHHATAGGRALPEIGVRRTADDARLTAVRAWMLGRLSKDAAGDWILAPVDAALSADRLGPKMELLSEREGFAIAVDVASYFECRYFECGPEPFEKSLARLLAPPPGASQEELDIAKLCTPAVAERIRRELSWWADNTVPGAMDWHRARTRAARGVMAP